MLVNSVVEAGPAAKVGLKAGDLIVSLNGEPVTVRFPEQVPPLMKRIADAPVGAIVRIGYERDGAAAEVEIVTEKLQKDRGKEAAFRAWGLTATEITEKLARDRRIDSTEGVLVTGVRSGGPAQLAEPPLDAGDVIRAIDDRGVHNLEEFARLYEAIRASESPPEYLLIEFDRLGKSHLTLLKPKPEEDEDPPREIRKGWVGVATQPVLQKLAEKLGRPEARGFRVTRIYPGTKAADSELRVGDIIVALNGEKLRPRGMQDAGLLARELRMLDIGQTATLTVLREGQTLEVRVELEPTRLTPAEARRDVNRDFELTVRELTFFDRDESRWSQDVNGVLVEQVESAGWAGLGGLRPRDLIQKVDAYAVTDLETYRNAMKAVAAAQPERVVVSVLRGSQTRIQFLEPDWKPATGGNKDE